MFLVPGIFAIIVFGLKLSIDFTGGSQLSYIFQELPDPQELRMLIEDTDISIADLSFEDSSVVLKTEPLEVEEAEELFRKIESVYPGVQQSTFETIGAVIGAESARKAVLSVVLASVAIVFYIAYAFKNIPSPYSSFRFGISAIVAMLHDAVIVLGVFAILGRFYNVEINSLFITALLTIIGFSIHDTIVVFDRIRENLQKISKNNSFEDIVNYSVIETMNRSIATSLTVVLTLFTLFLLGGESLKYFVLALLIGIISGTFSSIFTASPVLVYWERFIANKSARVLTENKKTTKVKDNSNVSKLNTLRNNSHKNQVQNQLKNN